MWGSPSGLMAWQDTRFPDEDTTRLRVALRNPTPLTLRIRHPGWTPGLEVIVNGERVQVTSAPSSYADVTRTWTNGDLVTVRMPMALRLEPMPDNPARVAIMFGPLVLAGDLGPHDDPAGLEPDYVPALLTAGHAHPRTGSRQRRTSRPRSEPWASGAPATLC
jgi:uncharacterized protein